MTIQPLALQIDVGASPVSALVVVPPRPVAACVLAHGAGAGMRHPFLQGVSDELLAREVATLRYQFPYMEQGRPRTDPPAAATATVRAAVAEAARVLPGVPLFAGGKSFGGRMTSTAAADAPLEGVRGIVFLGFPLHPPRRPGRARSEHLCRVTVPMLFLQGTRDDLADLALIREVARGLGPLATLHVVDGADHSFAVPKRSGRGPEDVMGEMGEVIAGWMRSVDG
jgi:predicted alpha/beta-hydrolase family hydrolase